MTFNIRVILAISSLLMTFAAGWIVEHWRSGVEIERLKAGMSARVAEAEKRARETEHRYQTTIERATSDARTKQQDLTRQLGAASDLASRLRDAAHRYASEYAKASAAAHGGETAGASPDVLAYVSGGLAEAAAVYAGEAAKSRVAGGACERIYDEVRAAQWLERVSGVEPPRD